MLRIANLRHTLMTGATVRLFILLVEDTQVGGFFRRIHDLQLVQSHLLLFAMPWTLLHVITEASPLLGHTAETLIAAGGQVS
jgi:inward rectifier potassium channel